MSPLQLLALTWAMQQCVVEAVAPPLFAPRFVTAAPVATTTTVHWSNRVGIVAAVGDVVMWYEQGTGSPPTFSGHVVSVGLRGVKAVHVADLNGEVVSPRSLVVHQR
jgi:hypothetical protein